jgi:hypothetical protein
LVETAARRSFRAAAVDEAFASARFAGCAWHAGSSSDGPLDVDTADAARAAATFRRWGALAVPHAYVLAVAMVLPVWWLTRAARRRKWRHRRGFEVRQAEPPGPRPPA